MSCAGPIHIRRATPGDAKGIAAVHVRTWQHAYRGLVPGTFLESLSVSRRAEFWRQELAVLHDDHRPWVAEVDGRIVGFVSAGASRDDGADPHVGEVYAIYVEPECWARGIGTNLMAHVRRDLRAHGYEAATLWVLRENEQARGFYERDGWRHDGAEREEAIGGVPLAEVRYRLAPV